MWNRFFYEVNHNTTEAIEGNGRSLEIQNQLSQSSKNIGEIAMDANIFKPNLHSVQDNTSYEDLMISCVS